MSFRLGVALALTLTACRGAAPPPAPPASAPTVAAAPTAPAAATLRLTTSAFTEGAIIPKPLTCDGADRSPALAWSGAPAATRSFALVVDDPDAPAGTWIHWVLFAIPADRRDLAEGVAVEAPLRGGANSWGKSSWGGPCPPPGKPHRYFFRLYALDVALDLAAGASRPALDAAMKGHVLAEATLMGRYGRTK